MIEKFDHVGIAVKDLEETLKIYKDLFGLEVGRVETIAEQKVRIASLPLVDVNIELLEATEADSPIAKFIEKRGEGIQHIAFRVRNVGKALEELKKAGVELIDEKPRIGAGGAKIAFLHPKAIKGVLLELCEK